MRQAFAEQDQISSRKRTDGVADKARTLPAREQGQLHLLMEVPVITLPLNQLRAARPQDAFDISERLRPAQDAEGVPFGQLDLLADGFHRVIRISSTPARKMQLRQKCQQPLSFGHATQRIGAPKGFNAEPALL